MVQSSRIVHGYALRMVRWMQVKDVGEVLHLSPTSIRAIEEDELPFVRTPRGGHRRYDPKAVIAYMRANGLEPPASLVERAGGPENFD